MKRGLLTWLQHGWKETVSEAEAVEHIAALLVKSLEVPEYSYQHCKLAAHAFYEAVRGFGKTHYGKDRKAINKCKLPCTNLMGNPRITIPATETQEI